MKRVITVFGAIAAAAFAAAYLSYGKVLQETYKFGADSDVAKAKCGACHVGKMGGKLNPYGNDLKAVTKGSKTLTAAMLKQIEGKDSDGDGHKNVDELKAGKNPGVK